MAVMNRQMVKKAGNRIKYLLNTQKLIVYLYVVQNSKKSLLNNC